MNKTTTTVFLVFLILALILFAGCTVEKTQENTETPPENSPITKSQTASNTVQQNVSVNPNSQTQGNTPQVNPQNTPNQVQQNTVVNPNTQTPPETTIQTCAKKGGKICSFSATCSSGFLQADDTDRCCSSSCNECTAEG